MDELLHNFAEFKEPHKEQHREMSVKLHHLDKEMAKGQEETAQLVAKKFKKTPEVHFKHKGNENSSFSMTLCVNSSRQHPVHWRR